MNFLKRLFKNQSHVDEGNEVPLLKQESQALINNSAQSNTAITEEKKMEMIQIIAEEIFHIRNFNESKVDSFSDVDFSEQDPLFEEAARLIVKSQIGGTGLLMHHLKISSNRAARLLDQLAEAGIVEYNQDFFIREVLMKNFVELEEYLNLLKERRSPS